MPTNIDQLQIEVETKSDGAVKGLKELKSTLESVDKVCNSSGLNTLCDKLEKITKLDFSNLKQLNALGDTLKKVENLTSKVDNLTAAISKVPDEIGVTVDSTGVEDAITDVEQVTSGINDVPEVTPVTVDTTSIDAAEVKTSRFRRAMDKVRGATSKAAVGIAKVISRLREASTALTKTTKKANGLAQILKIVVVYGGAFRAFAMLTQGVGEGLQNIAQYSEETATAMSKLSTISLQLKNSIGAALYPVIVAMTPALLTMANAIIRALNVVNQFVASMNGSKTYIRAKEYLKQYGDTAKKTAEQIKKSFAGMDEITVLGKQDSGKSEEDNPADMFEEVPIDESAVSGFERILKIAGLVGVAIGGWKIGSFISELVTAGVKVESLEQAVSLFGKKLSLTAGVTLVITGIALETAGIVDAIKNGLNGINFAKILGGGGAIVAGGALIGKFFGSSIIGAAIGAIVAGVPMYITGLYDAIVSGLDWLNASLIGVGATLAGAGIGAIIGMLGGPIGAGIGALIGLAVGLITDLVILIVENWGVISDFFVGVWASICDFFSGIATWIYDNVIQPIIDFFTPLIEIVVAVFDTIWSVISTIFTAIYDVCAYIIGTIIDIVVGLGNAIWAVISKVYEIISTIVQMIWAIISWLAGLIWDFICSIANWVWEKALKPVVDFVTNVVNTIVDKFKSIVNTIKTKVIDPILDFFKGMIEKVTGFFKDVGKKVVDGISGTFKSVMNGVFTLVENFVNFFIKGLNGVIGIINEIPGVSIKKVELLQIPRFATGGFPEDGLFMANHNELVGKFSNGKTAVANNDQIVAGITGGVYAANQEQNGLLREQNTLLRQLVEKQSNGQIDVTTITTAMQKKNRRDGKTLVPIGI